MSEMAERLTRLLSQFPELELAFLFGSHGRNQTGADSDIDLALLADAPIAKARRIEITEALGLEFGRAVDIVDLYHAPEPILGQVLKGKRLLGDDQTYARLLTRHVLNTADFLPLRERILATRRKAWIECSRLSSESAERMRKAVGFRNIAIHHYQAIDWGIVWAICRRSLDDFRHFVQQISRSAG